MDAIGICLLLQGVCCHRRFENTLFYRKNQQPARNFPNKSDIRHKFQGVGVTVVDASGSGVAVGGVGDDVHECRDVF